MQTNKTNKRYKHVKFINYMHLRVITLSLQQKRISGDKRGRHTLPIIMKTIPLQPRYCKLTCMMIKKGNILPCPAPKVKH